MEYRKVVITGLGLATPLGLEVGENWSKALSGTSGVSKLDIPGGEKSPVQAAGQVSSEDWVRICREFPAEAETEGERRTLFALWAAKKSLIDSGLGPAPGNRSRYGVAFAAGLGVVQLEDICNWLDPRKNFDSARFSRELSRVNRESIIRNNSCAPARLISDLFRLNGTNSTVISACAAATQAIGIAFRTIRRGEADLILAGGADSMINPIALTFMTSLGSTSTSRIEPKCVCRPFDRKRSGLVLGEGAGAAVLEDESHALARGARIYAEVAGYSSSMDAWKLTAPHPEGRGAELSMRRALEDAGIGPEDVDYINAHGTATKLNDIAETTAIKKVFGEFAGNLAISSSKSLIGHLVAAAGGPEFVFTVLSVAKDEVHPTINLTTPDQGCDLDYVPNTSRKKVVRAALSNSFGFAGQNATVVVRKYS
jgi:3-oxoacyl-[acyl-carrier-protein] synthase II